MQTAPTQAVVPVYKHPDGIGVACESRGFGGVACVAAEKSFAGIEVRIAGADLFRAVGEQLVELQAGGNLRLPAARRALRPRQGELAGATELHGFARNGGEDHRRARCAAVGRGKLQRTLQAIDAAMEPDGCGFAGGALPDGLLRALDGGEGCGGGAGVAVVAGRRDVKLGGVAREQINQREDGRRSQRSGAG